MKNYLFTILLIAINCLSTMGQKKAQEKPNIVVILCDDLGYGDLSAYGHPTIKTPHLDNMAQKGILMTNCYSSAPVCSPSRAGLLTGKSPNKVGIYDFIPGYKRSDDLRDLVHLQEFENTIPSVLKSAGYATCLSGKWHCSSRFNSDAQPKPDYFGFDHWFATHNNASPSHQNPSNFVRNGNKVGELEGFSCQIVVDEAIGWLNTKPTNQPFYLQITFHEPHEPIASPQQLIDKYLPLSENEAQAKYFANVENMDLAVGRLLNYLEENKLENTLIFFTSDNGPETLMRYSRAKHSYGSPGELKGMKLWTNEAGIRVPGILYWMGNETFNGTSDAVISALDLMPTLAEISGVQLENKHELDGESFVKWIKTGQKKRVKPLVWAFYDALNQQRVAMRSEDWKVLATLTVDGKELPKLHNLYDGNEALVKSAKLTNFELYDIKNDLGETNNLASSKPKVLKKMKKVMEEEYQLLLEESFIWRREN
ncbi:arylsulfatase [Flammeovirga sp. SJP92]|nr:arylsulfatase [Flammeovirga sp. SJP92]